MSVSPAIVLPSVLEGAWEAGVRSRRREPRLVDPLRFRWGSGVGAGAAVSGSLPASAAEVRLRIGSSPAAEAALALTADDCAALAAKRAPKPATTRV